MPEIPSDRNLDSTLDFLRDPYQFISERSRRFQSDLFETRLLLQKAICMTGPETAGLFYDPNRFVRSGASPGRIRKTLFGEGGVQGLDDDPHRHRKQMIMALMTPEQIEWLAQTSVVEWQTVARKWASMNEVVLYDELHEILTRAVCSWAGVPLPESEIERRTQQITALFDGAGAIGPRHWRSRLARRNAEKWIAGFIQEVRGGGIEPPAESAAYVIAWHRDPDCELLSPRVAAVELLNILRPTVAVSVYITLAAHALHQHPESRQALGDGEADYPDIFVQEVRRFYPFFPAVMARVRHDFDWNGYRFPQGRRVILDLYGTNHDDRTWSSPEEFRPERFREWDGSPFNFIPQGGGDHYLNHRCPGEWITIELMKVAVEMLGRRMSYDVPDQELRIDYKRLPALPRSRFVIRNVGLAS